MHFTINNLLGPTSVITRTPNEYQADLLGISNELLTITTTLESTNPINLNYPKKIITQNIPIITLNTTNQK